MRRGYSRREDTAERVDTRSRDFFRAGREGKFLVAVDVRRRSHPACAGLATVASPLAPLEAWFFVAGRTWKMWCGRSLGSACFWRAGGGRTEVITPKALDTS